MVTVYCALYQEAQELIRIYHLKKETDRRHFQTFSSEEAKIRLVVTGVGTAATAVAETSTLYPRGKTDVLVNFGSCGGSGFSLEEVYLCNKIVDAAGGRTYYPDILYRHPFPEAEITSFPRPQAFGQLPKGVLCDMEAAAVYQSGSYYYSTHQMIFLKAVTDHGVTGKVSSLEFGEQMKTMTARVTGFLDRLREISALDGGRKPGQLSPAWILEEFHGSKTMCEELRQLLRYFELTGTDYETVFHEYRRSGRLPCDKREGKKILEELKSRLF